MTGWDDINSLKDQLQSHPILGDPSRVLLLACHGSMASSEQVTVLLARVIANMIYCLASLNLKAAFHLTITILYLN